MSDEDTLVQAVLNRVQDGRRIAFLVGSALAAPFHGCPGVPDVEGMIRLIGERYSGLQRDQFERAIRKAGARRYQVAFARLLATHGVAEVNRTIRKAVLRARLTEGPETRRALAGDRDACMAIERDVDGWSVSPGAEALGKLLARSPPSFGELVLTSNFDPLIEVSILRAAAVLSGPRCTATGTFAHWRRTAVM